LALNVLQWGLFGPLGEVSESLEQSGYPAFPGSIIIGTLVYLLYNRLLWGTGVSIQSERWMGTIEVLFVTPTNKMTVLLASGVSSLVEASWWIICIFGLSWMLFGVQSSITSWPTVFLCLTSTMVALLAVGVFFGGFFILTRAADQLASGLQAPIRFFSGVAFPVDLLPEMLRFVSFVIPVTYGVLTLRDSMLSGGDMSTTWPNIVALYTSAALFLLLAHFTIKAVERRAKKNGTLYMF
jgi:ABC-2 type transport system permease protein